MIKGYFIKEGNFHKVFDKSCCCCFVTKSCLTLCDPVNCSPPGSSVHEFPKQKYCSRLPFLSPGNLFNPGIKPGSPVLQANSLLSEPPRKPDMIRGSYPQIQLFLCIVTLHEDIPRRVSRSHLSGRTPVLLPLPRLKISSLHDSYFSLASLVQLVNNSCGLFLAQKVTEVWHSCSSPSFPQIPD